MNICDPESIAGEDNRPEWLSLATANCILIDGISIDAFGTNRYARFRNFLFDSGFVPIKGGLPSRSEAHVLYGRSSHLHCASDAGVAGTDFVSMESLGNHGRFGNQIWQYLFVRMYGLRNGLVVRVPRWEGETVFCFSDERPLSKVEREQLSLPGIGDVDLGLWEVDDPPRNIDFKGYFQNVPSQWRVHKDFVRNTFRLRPDWHSAVTALYQSLARTGCTIVAVHVRRGDYKRGQYVSPLYRLVPVDWYIKLLDDIWPRLSKPILHVSTDEPSVIRPLFKKYEQLDVTSLETNLGMPTHVLDFVVLKESDHLLACNSSFSTSAALLGKPGQRCYIADFDSESFVPYDPWTEVSFTRRFLPQSRSIAGGGYGSQGARRHALTMALQVAANIRMQAEINRLQNRIKALEASSRSPLKRIARHAWRTVRDFWPLGGAAP